MTTQLHFKLPDHLVVENADRVPVEVTEESLASRAVSRLGEAVALGVGVYGATATLPDGRKLSGAVRIDEGDETALVALNEIVVVPMSRASATPSSPPSAAPVRNDPAPADASDDTELGDAPDISVAGQVEGVVVAPGVLGTPRAAASARSEDAPNAFAGKLALLRGNGWAWGNDVAPEPFVPDGWNDAEASPTERPNRGFVSLPVQGSETPQSVLFMRPNRRVIVVALPVEPRRRCDVQLRLTPKDGIFPHVSFCDRDVDLLLRYAGAGLLGEARKVADAPSLLARDFIEDKEEHPVGAALAFYLLLRLGDETLSTSWTERLTKVAPWLADGLVIHAELLARHGEHEAAARCLAELPKRGLPLFTSGLSYAVERLGQYESWVEAKRAKSVENVPEVRAALRRISLCCDPTRPILTYQVGEALDLAAFESAVGRTVTLAAVPNARAGRSVEFRAPPTGSENSVAAAPMQGWLRPFQLRGDARSRNATSAIDEGEGALEDGS